MTSKKRNKHLKSLWPEVQRKEAWPPPQIKGWAKVPRTLPLLLGLMKTLTKRVDARTTYVDLMCRIFSGRIVQVVDEQEHAFCAGFTGKRGVKSWRERMKLLQELGFIDIRPHLQREIGFVLVRDPHLVAAELFEKGMVSDEWWAVFQDRMHQVSAHFGAEDTGDDEEDDSSTPPVKPKRSPFDETRPKSDSDFPYFPL